MLRHVPRRSNMRMSIGTLFIKTEQHRVRIVSGSVACGGRSFLILLPELEDMGHVTWRCLIDKRLHSTILRKVQSNDIIASHIRLCASPIT